MSFKDWYEKADRTRRDEDFARPFIYIENEDHYKLVITNLERLGFLDGNDFSRFGLPVIFVDIWYDDFWNSHISEKDEDVLEFEFTLEEIVGIEKRLDWR